jgi:tetratricopeptide (TPR) repeat protein
MYNKNNEEVEIEALNLIDRADDLVAEGKGKEAIDLYERAAQKYLDLGSYMKIDELFIKISSIISKFKNNIQAAYRLKSIVRKTEELGLKEISAKLLIQLGDLSYKMRDYETAAQSWKKASTYFGEMNVEDFSALSAKLLIKAGEAFERTTTDSNEGERLMIQGVMKINEVDEKYREGEKRALKLLNMDDYEAAAEKFITLSKYFQKAVNNLDELSDSSDNEEIMKNVKSRLLHLQGEYVLVAALSLRASENREYNLRIKELGDKSFSLLKESIDLLKSISDPSKLDKEDILRLTFDTMLLSIVQGMLGEHKIDSIEFLLSDIGNQGILKKIKKSEFYELSERIAQVGIQNSLDELESISLGHLNKVKNLLIPLFR